MLREKWDISLSDGSSIRHRGNPFNREKPECSHPELARIPFHSSALTILNCRAIIFRRIPNMVFSGQLKEQDVMNSEFPFTKVSNSARSNRSYSGVIQSSK